MAIKLPPSVALEGPCCAGKTTLGRSLKARCTERVIAHVRDYSDYVGGGRFLPTATPRSLEEERDALDKLLRIELERTSHVRTETGNDLILIDRSIHTLLAHCAALERMTGVRFASLAEDIIARSSVPLWPSAIIYLDIPNDIARQRNTGKFPMESIFMDPVFNAGFRLYFEKLTALKADIPVLWIDATLSLVAVRDLACLTLREVLLGTRGGNESS